jgi:hypothetical protein
MALSSIQMLQLSFSDFSPLFVYLMLEVREIAPLRSARPSSLAQEVPEFPFAAFCVSYP